MRHSATLASLRHVTLRKRHFATRATPYQPQKCVIWSNSLTLSKNRHFPKGCVGNDRFWRDLQFWNWMTTDFTHFWNDQLRNDSHESRVFFEKKLINFLVLTDNLFFYKATLAWVPKNSNNCFQFAICAIKLFLYLRILLYVAKNSLRKFNYFDSLEYFCDSS